MDPKSGLRPYLQTDVEDIVNALIDDQGNVNSQIMIVVNGRQRLVNVGLIQSAAKFIWDRCEPTPIADSLHEIFTTAFTDYAPPVDIIEGYGEAPRKLIRAGLTKRDGVLAASLTYKRQFGTQTFGRDRTEYYVSEPLTKYQQTYLMHLLLAHGKGGHVGHGMVDWDLYADLETGENRFELRNQ